MFGEQEFLSSMLSPVFGNPGMVGMDLGITTQMHFLCWWISPSLEVEKVSEQATSVSNFMFQSATVVHLFSSSGSALHN